LTPEAVVYRYLDATKAIGVDGGGLGELCAVLGTDADLLGRWLTLLACPADPDALERELTRIPPHALSILGGAMAWLGAPLESARLSTQRWRQALHAACVGEMLAESAGHANPRVANWQLLVGLSGFQLPHDGVVDEIQEFRGAAPALLEDADPLLKIAAVANALHSEDMEAAGRLAERLLSIAQDEFQSHIAAAEQAVARRLEDLGLADADDNWSERLWARQQVGVVSALFAQCDSLDALGEIHQLAGNTLFGFTPYLMLFDEARDAVVPVGQLGVGILVDSASSAIARSLRERAITELNSGFDQAVADRQVLRRLNAQEALCLPLTDGQAPLGVLIFRLEEDADQSNLATAYAGELASWIARLAAPRSDRADRLERFREIEEQRLREIVHEANNPLSIVHNYLYILELRLQHEPAAAEQIRMITAELKRVAEIIQRARDVPEAESDTEQADSVRFEAVALNSLARQTLELHRGYAADHDVQLEAALTDESLDVSSDSQRLAQVLNNLLRNAIEACSGASVTVGTAAGVFRSGREGVELSVSDTGPGLPRGVLEHLTVPKQTNKGGDHSGLGLHIVHRLVEEVGASIDVRSAPGQGTRFTIFLPLDPE